MIQVLLLGVLLSGAPPAPPPPAAPPPSDGGKLTRQNWAKHPKIVAIRSLVQQTEEAIKAGKLKHQQRTDCGGEDGPVNEGEAIDRDASGVIRKYVHAVGTEDSAYSAEEHYDERGRLRFVFAKRGAAPTSSSGEFRIYFDEDGQRLWTDQRHQGSGYTWLPDFPEQWLVKDPEKAWKHPPPCE